MRYWLGFIFFILGGILLVNLLRRFSLGLHIINFLLFLLCSLPNALIHELGHVLAATAMGIKIKRVEIGQGRPLLKIQCCGIPVILMNLIPGRGSRTYEDNIPVQRIKFRFFFYTAGGVLLQGLTILVIMLLNPSAIMDVFLKPGINPAGVLAIYLLFSILLNLIPRKLSKQGIILKSDGLQLLEIPLMKNRQLWPHSIGGSLLDALDLMNTGDYEQAGETLRSILTKYPDYIVPRINLSVVYMRQLEFSQAEALLLELLSFKHDAYYAALIFNNLAWIALLRNDAASLKSALEYALKAYTLNSGLAAIDGTYAFVLIETGQWQTGQKLLQRLLSYHNPMTFFFLGYSYYLQEEYQLAGRYLLPVLDNRQLSPDEKYLCAKVTEKMDGFGKIRSLQNL